MHASFVNMLFDEEPAGAFAEGHIFTSSPDFEGARDDPANGYWHCDIADHDKLTWSDKVYELFGMPAGAPVGREWAVAHYEEASRNALQRVRKYALSRGFGFILDAAIVAGNDDKRWIRVLAVPIQDGDRIVALHGFKRAL